MSELGQQLTIDRKKLTDQLDQGAQYVLSHWTTVEPLMNGWWTAFKKWEANDTFEKAFKHKRMTVRTFGGGYGGFDTQVSKTFKKGSISLADSTSTETVVKIFADSKYTPLEANTMKEHDDRFHKTD